MTFMQSLSNLLGIESLKAPPRETLDVRSAPLMSLDEGYSFLHQGREGLLSEDVEDMDARFRNATVSSNWLIAMADLQVFDAGMRATKHTTACMYLEGATPPSAIEYNGKILSGADPVGREQRITLYDRYMPVAEAHPLTAVAGSTIETAGWFVMLKSLI